MRTETVERILEVQRWSLEQIKLEMENEAVLIDGRLILRPCKNRGSLILFAAYEKGIGFVEEDKFQMNDSRNDPKGDFGVLRKRITHSKSIYWIGERYRVTSDWDNTIATLSIQSQYPITYLRIGKDAPFIEILQNHRNIQKIMWNT